MLGSIIGDIIGSTYEFNNAKDYNFDPFPPGSDFTDDTVLTIAVADAILNKRPYEETIREYAIKWPNRGYGGMFRRWYRMVDPQPYNSFGNGSAMRVSPVGWAFDTLEKTIEEARKSAECTHNHPEGIKGAESVAAAIFLSRQGSSKTEIREFIQNRFHYNLTRTLSEIIPGYKFNETCQKTVPEAITCFLESENYEDAIRKAIWLGGDSDTLACITGGIAEAFDREIPEEWEEKADSILPQKFRKIINDFRNTISAFS
jgi:ADP-ribosylglycohydrolase